MSLRVFLGLDEIEPIVASYGQLRLQPAGLLTFFSSHLSSIIHARCGCSLSNSESLTSLLFLGESHGGLVSLGDGS